MEIKRIKHCGKCNTTKSIKDFNSHADTYDGKQVWCRECTNRIGCERYHKLKDRK